MEHTKLKVFDLATAVETKAERADVVPLAFLREDVTALKRELHKQSHSLHTEVRAVEAKAKKLNCEPEVRKLAQRLASKAGQEETAAALRQAEMKLEAVEDTMKTFIIEVEKVARLVRHSQAQIGELTLSQSDILAGTRSVNCLVCGRNQVGSVILTSPEHRRKQPPPRS